MGGEKWRRLFGRSPDEADEQVNWSPEPHRVVPHAPPAGADNGPLWASRNPLGTDMPGGQQQPSPPGPLWSPLSEIDIRGPRAGAHRVPELVTGPIVQPPVAAVRGTVAIDRVTVGEPGPDVASKPTAERFRSVPFRPDTVVDGWSTSGATVRAASMRGHVHRYNGAPRQDDVAVHSAPSGRIIVVVADGVSAAIHAHVGANTVTTAAAQWLLAHAGDQGVEVDWMEMIPTVSWAMAERARALNGADEMDPSRIEHDFAATMVAAVIDPDPDGVLHAQAVGIGDSSAWVLRQGEFEPILGGKSIDGDGIATSAVVGLPRIPAHVTPVLATVVPGDVFLIGSDGVGDPLGSGHGGVGDLLRAVLTPSVPSLIEFAHAVDFSRETFDDDRTLVAVWPGHQSH